MSQLKVNTIRHTGASSDAIELASDGTCTAKITNQPPGNRNKIINGAMTINQRSHSGTAGNNAYTLDRWKYQRSANAEFDVVQSTEQAPGFANCLRLDCTTGSGTVGAGDYVKLRYHLEGFDVQDFAKGTASAKKFALSFYVKTSTTGVYAVSLLDENSRMVTGTYTVSDTNWNRYSIIFPADTTGTCANDNSAELSIEFNIIAGSNRTSGTDLRTAWGTYATASEAVGHTANPGSSASNNVYITGVQLEVGDVATDFEHRSHGEELARCQRYFQKYNCRAQEWIYVEANGAQYKWWWCPFTAMRSQPTTDISGLGTGSGFSAAGTSETVSSIAQTSISNAGDVNGTVSYRLTFSGTFGTSWNMHHIDGWNGQVVTFSSEL